MHGSIFKVISVTGLLGLSISCAGSMDDSGSNDPVGTHAELVAQKRAWLKGYHDDCQICFSAFEQCQLGARSALETESCQVALDSCVRGGLIDDDSDGGADVDAGVDEQEPNGAGGAGGGNARDAGVNGGRDAGAGAGRDAGIGRDAGPDNPADPGGGAKGDKNKAELLEDVGACLTQIRACVRAPNADRKACIEDLKTCVKTAVGGAFDSVCAQQLSLCVKERVPEDALESVRSLCEEPVTP